MGISGQTTGEVLERLGRECKGRTLEGADNIIILAAGINDTQIAGGEILTGEEEFCNNVKGLIRAAKRRADKVLYVGLTPVREKLTDPWAGNGSSWKNDTIVKYDGMIREICAKQGVRYIYMFDKVDPLTNEDGLHPSAESHKIMSDIVASEVYDCMKQKRPRSSAAERVRTRRKDLSDKVRGKIWK